MTSIQCIEIGFSAGLGFFGAQQFKNMWDSLRGNPPDNSIHIHLPENIAKLLIEEQQNKSVRS